MTTVDLLAQSAARGTLILATAFAAARIAGRASAAVRHWVWTTAFVALLLLPLATLWTPKWSVVEVSAPAPSVIARAVAGAPASRPATNPLPWIYAAGLFAAALRFAAGAWRTRALLAGAVPAGHAAGAVQVLRNALGIRRRVRTVESPKVPVPLTWGIVRPLVALPDTSRQWPASRLHAVLLHELTHVQRHDLLAQFIAQAACAVYWFHPLAWFAAREQRRERERACDDAVLGRGVAAPEYAGHLMDLVRGMAIDAPAMAEAGDFESRVRALLEPGRNRSPLSRRVALAVGALACVLILPVASITSHAQTAAGALAGIVKDPSGARVPNAQILIRNLDARNIETTRSNAAGEYTLAAIPTGRYSIETRVPGFALAKTEIVVVAGAAARVDVNLELGQISEAITVRAQRPAPATTAAAAARPAAERIRVGGSVQAARLTKQSRPEYPEQLQQQGVSGVVMIRAVISKYGVPLNPEVINTGVHPALVKAALDSVREWRYEPTLLNGEPVEVLTTIEIAYEPLNEVVKRER